MSRVKMNAKHEYEYIANFKILQNIFKAKKIDKVRILCVGIRQIVFNIPEAHFDRETREMQNAVRPCLNRS